MIPALFKQRTFVIQGPNVVNPPPNNAREVPVSPNSPRNIPDLHMGRGNVNNPSPGLPIRNPNAVVNNSPTFGVNVLCWSCENPFPVTTCQVCQNQHYLCSDCSQHTNTCSVCYGYKCQLCNKFILRYVVRGNNQDYYHQECINNHYNTYHRG